MTTHDEAMAHLEYRFPGLEFDQAGGVCPFQAEGTLHGAPFYFRFRHSWAELRIQSEQSWWKPLYAAGCQYGDPDEDRGWLEGPEFVELMTRLIGELERAPIYWEFPGVEPAGAGAIRAGDPQRYGSWAHSAEQAWENLHRPSAYLTQLGWSDERQAELVAARRLSPECLTVDDRVFPNPDPFAKGK